MVALASTSLDYCLHTLATEFGIPYQQLDAIFRETYQSIQLRDQPPFPGLAELCTQLVAVGVQQFIVTHRRRESLMRLLSTHGLDSYFTHIIAADDGFPRKPSPDAMLHVLTSYAIDPSDALVIGDRDVDILAGQAAGISTCLFRAAFPEIMPTRSIWDYNELADIVPATAIGTPGTMFEARG